MKDGKFMNMILKGSIIGLGTLGGLVLSRLFSVQPEESEGDECDETAAIDVPYADVPSDEPTGE